MAKPDWGALQHQFLAEHARTGISPKEWCEAQGFRLVEHNTCESMLGREGIGSYVFERI